MIANEENLAPPPEATPEEDALLERSSAPSSPAPKVGKAWALL
jgi:hypothetical protein